MVRFNWVEFSKRGLGFSRGYYTGFRKAGFNRSLVFFIGVSPVGKLNPVSADEASRCITFCPAGLSCHPII